MDDHGQITNPPETSRREFVGGLLAATAAAAAGLAPPELSLAQTGAATEVVMADPPRVPLPLDEAVHDSHVGNLFGPISRIRDAYGWASESFAQEKFKAQDFPAWQKAMREVVFEAMKYRPDKCEFDVETVEKIDHGSYVREKIYFNTTPELRVPAYVLVPKSAGGASGRKAPAIVALHDH